MTKCRTRQVRRRRQFARPSLAGNTSAGSRSCRHPPRGTKTSGLNSRPSRTPARTLSPARTLFPPVSASPSPGRPTRSLPPPDVDSHAPAAFLGYFARPPRVLHVASQCQAVTASAVARRARPRETVSSVQFARGNRVERLFEDFDGRWTSGSGDGFTAGLRRRGAADFETTHGPWLPFHPFDECPRNLVFHDHDAQDAIFPQERSGANSGGLDGGIRSPHCGKIGRGASPHRRDESEHDVDGRASQSSRPAAREALPQARAPLREAASTAALA